VRSSGVSSIAFAKSDSASCTCCRRPASFAAPKRASA
jgi:hypothetical protein